MSFENWQKENESTSFDSWKQQNTAMLLSEEDAPLASTYSGMEPDTAQEKADNVYKLSQKYELPFSEIERLNAEADAINIHTLLTKPAPDMLLPDDPRNKFGLVSGLAIGKNVHRRTEEETIAYNYSTLPDNPRMKIMADRYISQRKSKQLAKEADEVEVSDVLDFNAYLAYFAGGAEAAEAIMRANLSRNKPKVAELIDDDTAGYLRDNPEQSFVPSIFNTKLDGARADEIDNLVAMEDREARNEYYKSKGSISKAEFFEKKDKREYMLFSDALKAMKNGELRGAIQRVQDPEGNYQKSNLTEHGFSVNFDRDMLLIRDHYFALEETEARGVDVFPMLLDMGLNMTKYMGEIALLAGLGGAKTGRVAFKGLRRAGVPKLLARNVSKLSSATVMAALNPSTTVNLTVERMTDKGVIDDFGNFVKTDEGQSIAKALPKSFTEATVTFFIEQKGDDLVKGLFKVGSKAISKLPRGLVSKLDEVADFMKKTGLRSFDKLPRKLKGNLRAIREFVAKGKPILRAGKFHGLLGENLEEYVDKVAKTVLLLDDQYRDKDDEFIKRVGRSLIPNPEEIMYQTILFTIMPFATGAIANTPRAINWVGEKVEAIVEGGVGTAEVYNRATFENNVQKEYGFDRKQAFEIADMFEANESIESIEKKVRTFDGFKDFAFDEFNNQRALTEMLLDRGLVVEEANRIAEITANEAAKKNIPIEDVIDTPNFKNQVENAERIPPEVLAEQRKQAQAAIEAETPVSVEEQEVLEAQKRGVKVEKPAKPLPAKEVTAVKVQEVKEVPKLSSLGKSIKTDRGAIIDARKDVNVGDSVTGNVLDFERGVSVKHAGEVVKVLKQAVDIITPEGEKLRLTSKIAVLSEADAKILKDFTLAQQAQPPKGEVKKPVTQKVTEKTIAQANTSEEVNEAIPKLTSARQADITADREALGLDEIPSPERKTWQTSLQNAKDAGIPDKALRIANDVIARPRALNDEATAGLVIAATKLKAEYKGIITKINESTDEAENDILSAEAANIEAEFDIITKALHQSGTEKGRALAAQKLTIDRGFDLISVKSRARAIKGKELSEKENKKFEELSAELESQTEAVTELQQRLSEMEANQIIKRGRRIVAKRTPAKLNADILSLGSKVRDLLKAGCN